MTPVILHQIAPSGSSAGKRLQYKKLIHDPSCTIYVLNRGGKWTRMYRLFMIQRVKAKKNIRHINITSHVYTIIPFIFVYNILIISYIYICILYIRYPIIRDANWDWLPTSLWLFGALLIFSIHDHPLYQKHLTRRTQCHCHRRRWIDGCGQLPRHSFQLHSWVFFGGCLPS